ncbi:MAG: Rpp14/Pop5 family protein [Candidatus Diapherotrites archaeon]
MPRKNPENLKSKRWRNRYILFLVKAERKIDSKQLLTIIKNFLRSKFGESFVTEARLKIIEFDGLLGIIRCSRQTKELVVESLNNQKIPDDMVEIKTLVTSGTIRALNKKKGKFIDILKECI